MAIIETVVRSLIFGPPRYSPKHPTHYAITLPEGFSLEELQSRIPQSPLPIISEQEITFRPHPCRLKSSGEIVLPRSIDFSPHFSGELESIVLSQGNNAAKIWVIDGDKCEVSDGAGKWFFLEKSSENWQVVKKELGAVFD